MKISIITPSIRKEALEINRQCLERQTFKSFEWIVVAPFTYKQAKVSLLDPPKREGDFYRLNGAWNKGFKSANGELFVSIVDGLYFNPDTLHKLWFWYLSNKKQIVSGVGHQYKKMENGKPEVEMWHDPRTMFPENELTNPQHIEWCLTSLPRQAIYDIGGMDSDYDQVSAWSEKDANLRMAKLGYQFLIDKSLEYRAIYHPRLSPDWDARSGYNMFQQKIGDLDSGKRSPNVDMLK